ncbi:conserved hypothetical protein [Leishmania infantum JPCM5]|uniref:Uncharacterized protein n=2 Tax=Leishmania infantum TaxID=5671 RepID=A4ICF2_LEIIN|nr:conserved hypothetical protein [Leishmania infantum JPCM5]CAC9550429.1 hypothetical_protein_-_conserved [Leishmania infantum]CAM72530.1 conserved hypothetical protein [Leishmania infantum JPCM5]SUZ46634.1 hypothetical_protein_-_conserved [Leishmania infantum]|eukprot:XP_001469421.1 conserved hypothetical protein [Leishmania infantum JPCM5]
MLQGILGSVSSTGIREAENVLRQSWPSLLKLKDEAQTRFCADAESFLKAQLTNRPAPSDTLAIFTTVYVTAVHAIHSGLVAPVRWTKAQDSPFRPSMPVERVLPSRREAARVVASVCERLLLANAKVAGAYFSKLLRETAMGVPLLALVLRAYGEAAVGVLSAHSEDPPYLQSCIHHLVLATYKFTVAMSDDALTIAHPILLHVARVSGRTQDAMQLLCRPIYSVSPMLTGIGLSDYVAYHAEAALLLAALEQYESAMYALTPVSQLSPTRGMPEGEKGSRGGAGEGDLPPWLNELEYEEADVRDAIPRSGGCAADASRAPVTGADSALPAQQSVVLYPWYRTECVGETRKYAGSTDAKDRKAEVKAVVWRGILVPSVIEREMDRRAVTWAKRLGIVLLAAAFGGGSPRGVMALTASAGRRIVDNEEASSIWTGMASAIAGHVCFPHPLFRLLTETTPVSLRSFVHFVTTDKTASARAYADLLVAIARRDANNAHQCLGNPANVSLFTADLTVDVVRATVLRELPRHILLDVARMYAHVPMQMLLDRSQPIHTAAKAKGATPANERAEDEERPLDAATVDSRHALVQLLVKMCSTGDLASSHVCVTAAPAADAAAKERATFYPVEEVARQLSRGTASFCVSTASVKWTLPSSAARLQRCAQVVQFHIHQYPSVNLDTSLVPMLAQLQELQRVVDAGAEEICDMGIV